MCSELTVLNSVIPVSGSDTITILVGNKCDLEDKREVDEADIRVSVPNIRPYTFLITFK